MDPTPRLVSIQVGQVTAFPAVALGEPEWHSAILKHPVNGPVFLGLLGLAGDAQADPKNHGGKNQAANVYPSEHYQFWRQTPGLEGMAGGAFGENLTTLGLLETNVCLGDIYRIGQAVAWISQPRQPCYKLDRRWDISDLSDRAADLGRIGWYFAVRQPGNIQAGDEIILIERPNPEWSIDRVWAVLRNPGDLAAVRSLAQATGLADKMRSWLVKKLPKG